jgi:CDP-diacylglycerol--glycerol-3-phosphate 3-phosphatidyltransferase
VTTQATRTWRNDPNALATWANAITVGRVLLSPTLFLIISGRKGSWGALALWFVLCSSDGLDGYVARRHGTTRSGAFLDPLADKILVLGAMYTLVGERVFSLWPVAIIAARELIISLYRSVVGTQGVSVPASKAAKVKTFTQQMAVAFALCPLTATRATWLWMSVLWLAVALTVYSGAQYLLKARSASAASASAELPS